MADRHVLISCALRHADSSKQLKSFKNAEKWHVAKTAVVAAMMEAHVSILHFQSVDKHFKSKNCLGNRDQTGEHSNPYLGAWLHLCLLHDCCILGCRVAPTQLKDQTVLTTSLAILPDDHTRHGRQEFMQVKPYGSFPYGICTPYTVDISRQTPKTSPQDCLLHVSRDAGLQQLSRECSLDGCGSPSWKRHLKFWWGSA